VTEDHSPQEDIVPSTKLAPLASLLPSSPTMGSLILVTGGAGYVGSHCVLELLNAGYQVVAIDNFTNAVKDPTGNTEYPESLLRVQKLTGKQCQFHQVDLLDKAAVREVFIAHPGVQCVIHFAALKAVGESFTIPLAYYGNNITGACNLLEVMNEVGVERVVFSSSATVYGVPEYLPLDEKHRTGECTNPYGTTKYTVEKMMMDLAASNAKWSVTLLRYFNPAGAHESGDIGEDPLGIPNNLMPYIAQVAIGRRKQISVYGDDYKTRDGTGDRDYVHVVDLAEGHVKAVQHILQPDREGVHIFNLGTGTGATVLEVIKAFSEASGKEIPYEIAPRRKGDVDSLYATCQVAEKVLGWKSSRSLTKMCQDMWHWQTKNPNGFQGHE